MTVTANPNGAAARHAAEPSIGALVAEASTSLSTLIRGELDLAKIEIKSSVKNAGTGVGFFGAAAVLMAFAMTFGLIALAEGLVAMGLWRWLSYLIVFGGLVVFVALLTLLGVRKVKRVRAPRRTIATSKDTVAYLKANTRRG